MPCDGSAAATAEFVNPFGVHFWEISSFPLISSNSSNFLQARIIF